MAALTAHARAVLALALMVACAAAVEPTADSTSYGTPGQYDLLVFVRFWTPQACYTEYDSACKSLNASSWAASSLSLHGLWPQYAATHSGNSYPQSCYETNNTYWSHASNLATAVTSKFSSLWGTYAPEYLFGLDTHEWQTHGVCYSSQLISAATNTEELEALQIQYFQDQMDLFDVYDTPSLLVQASRSGQTVTLAQLQAAFGGADYVALDCDESSGKYFLNSVSLCLGKDANGNPTSPVKCPTTVTTGSANSCVTSKVSAVHIPSWSVVEEAYGL